MTDFWKKATDNWQDSVNLILGLWLIVSPWVLGFAGLETAMWNAVVFGLVIAAMALAALTTFRDWEEWIDMAIGAWLTISPWVLGFATGAEGSALTGNFVVAGLLVLALSAWSLVGHHRGAQA
ncbi:MULTISPECIES: SPW repeat protein [Paracoccaceae]|jgi:hypothetical protein|uniref:SPW repeat protein n=1 Tax=Paracoccaceae TaxID=31989 RepID=UPI003048DFB7